MALKYLTSSSIPLVTSLTLPLCYTPGLPPSWTHPWTGPTPGYTRPEMALLLAISLEWALLATYLEWSPPSDYTPEMYPTGYTPALYTPPSNTTEMAPPGYIP